MKRGNVVQLPDTDTFDVDDETARGIVAMYTALSYNVFGVSPDAFDDPIEQVRFAVFAQRMSSLRGIGHPKYCELLLRPGRSEFDEALREMDADALVEAYHVCKLDGMEEIEAEFHALRSYLKPLWRPSECPS